MPIEDEGRCEVYSGIHAEVKQLPAWQGEVMRKAGEGRFERFVRKGFGILSRVG